MTDSLLLSLLRLWQLVDSPYLCKGLKYHHRNLFNKNRLPDSSLSNGLSSETSELGRRRDRSIWAHDKHDRSLLTLRHKSLLIDLRQRRRSVRFDLGSR